MIDAPQDTALLVTRSAGLAAGLCALLLTIPPIAHVERLPGLDTLFTRLAAAPPRLIVLDANAAGPDVVHALRAIRRASPESHHLVLSDTVSEVRRLTAGGAGMVVVKGTHPEWLADTIQGMLDAPPPPGPRRP